MPQIVRTFTDLNLSFSAHPITGDVARLTNEDAVKRAIRHLVLTNFYERPFQPGLGSGIAQLMFEPASPITSRKIKTAIEDVIRNYEKRAKVLDVKVILRLDKNEYEAEITFQVVNLLEPVTVKLFLERSR